MCRWGAAAWLQIVQTTTTRRMDLCGTHVVTKPAADNTRHNHAHHHLQSVADRHTQAACGDTCVVHDGMESMGAWLGPQDSRKVRNRTETIWSAVELQTA
jgi:hypothetical protein